MSLARARAIKMTKSISIHIMDTHGTHGVVHTPTQRWLSKLCGIPPPCRSHCDDGNQFRTELDSGVGRVLDFGGILGLSVMSNAGEVVHVA